jgi:hypothetical protein
MHRRESAPLLLKNSSLSELGLLAQKASGQLNQATGDHKNVEEHMSRRSSAPLLLKSSSLTGLLAQKAPGQLNQTTGDHKRRSVSSSTMSSRIAQAQVGPDSTSLMMRSMKRKSNTYELGIE